MFRSHFRDAGQIKDAHIDFLAIILTRTFWKELSWQLTLGEFNIMRLTVVSTLVVVFQALSSSASAAEGANEITTVQSLTLERVLDPANFVTTLPSLIPQPVLAGVTSQTVEIRDQFLYSGGSGVVKYTQFTVPTGTPIPTPATLNISGSTYLVAQLAVQKILVGSNPQYPSVQFSGSIVSTQGPMGSMTGTPATLSFGYTTGAQTTFNNVLSSIGGIGSGYSTAGVGSMTLAQTSVSNNPCGGPIAITATIISTTTNYIELDGSQSFDCSGQPITSYQWGVLNPLGSVTVINPTSPKAFAHLNAGPGEYSLTFTVTNTSGISTTSSILVTYTSPH